MSFVQNDKLLSHTNSFKKPCIKYYLNAIEKKLK